jgi:signal transduction histidine kinase
MELALDAPERLDLMADPQRLGQVVDNFLSNALKYAPAGSRVDVLVEREDGRAAVRVRDQGPGIAEQDRAMLFGLFQRLSAKPAPGARSRGLGLAVCRRIMQAHGGDIGMESGPGPGARFYLALPLGGGE